jgi:hypothetical protein
MKRSFYRWPCIGSLFVLTTVPAVMATIAPGCGDEIGTKGAGAEGFSCGNPIFNRTDDYGHPDPCCHYKPCCPSPVLDHYAIDPGSDPPVTLWDPCCLSAECPPHNVFLPAGSTKSIPSTSGDAGTDAQTSSCTAPCDGECLARADLPMWGPLLAWIGPVDQQPVCPYGTTPVAGEHHADLNVPPLDCPTCSCDPPTGTCDLPATMTASSGKCYAPNAIHSDTNPPANWDGSCTAANPIAAGAACNGGPCVNSLTVAPLTLTESGCAPRAINPPTPAPPPSWKASAVMCNLEPCDAGKSVCVPKVSSPVFWETCLAFAGDTAVCSAPYPVRHVVYDSFTDGRTCGTCTCQPPTGASCVSVLSVFEGTACKGPAAIPGNLITSKPQPFCFDLPPGIALGSKMMTPPVYYSAGLCESVAVGGSGEVTTQGAMTLCCLQS